MIKIDRIGTGRGKIENFVDIDINGTILKGLKVVNTNGRRFLSWPAIQHNGRWYDVVRPSDKLRSRVEEVVFSSLREMTVTNDKQMDLFDKEKPFDLEKHAAKIAEALHGNAAEIFGQPVRTMKAGFRAVKIENFLFMQQNPNKGSKWAKLAREGHKITWILESGVYVARVFDGKYEKL